MLAAGRTPPSPRDGVCVKMRSSWRRAPRGQTSAESKQNHSGGQQSGPEVRALCSGGLLQRSAAMQGLRPAHGRAEELLRRRRFLLGAAPGHRDNSCPQRKWAEDHLGVIYAGEPPSRPLSCQPMPSSRCAPQPTLTNTHHCSQDPHRSRSIRDWPCPSPSPSAPGHPGLWLPDSSVPCPHHHTRFLLPQGSPRSPPAADLSLLMPADQMSTPGFLSGLP